MRWVTCCFALGCRGVFKLSPDNTSVRLHQGQPVSGMPHKLYCFLAVLSEAFGGLTVGCWFVAIKRDDNTIVCPRPCRAGAGRA